MPINDAPKAGSKSGWLQKLPFLVVVAAALLGAVLLRDQISFETLARHRETLIAYRDANYGLSALVFIAVYIGIVGLSLPGATVATLAGGFLFGLFPGVLFNVIGAGTGAIAIFLAARSGLGASVSARIAAAGGVAARLQTGLQENEWSVLFLMRLVPAVPFVLANLIPAFVGTSLTRFAVSTFIGILPGALVFTLVGSGLGEVFARGETPDLGLLFTPAVLGPILGFAALAALPMVLRVFRRAR